MKRSISDRLSLPPAITPHIGSLQRFLFILIFLSAVLAMMSLSAHAAQPTWCGASGQSDIPEAECLALEELYNSTDGDNWLDNSGWLTSTAVCTAWLGVECSNGQVSKLTLNSNNLNGPLPAELSDLSALTALDLTDNLISSTIPTSLGSLGSLTSLLLGSNQLEGAIPGELGQLSALTTLDLGDNRLEGSIPVDLGQLTNLTVYLFLEGNKLDGPIPAAVCSLSPLLANIDYNKLDVSDLSPASCDTTFPDWRLTQTVPPTNVFATDFVNNTGNGVTAVSADVTLTWLPIAYTGDGGNYEVFTRRKTSGTIKSEGTTADKTADTLTVTVNGAATDYLYFVRTNTPAHQANQNDLQSVNSEEVEFITNAIRLVDMSAAAPLIYFPALAPLLLLVLTGAAVVVVRKRGG